MQQWIQRKIRWKGRMMITDEELGRELLKLKVIWFGMLGSLVIYLIIGLVIAINLERDEVAFIVLKTVFYILTFAILTFTRHVKSLILSRQGQHREANQNLQSTTLRKYATAMIVTWALLESTGVFGLVLLFLGSPFDLYLLILISAAAMLWYRPKKDDLISLAQNTGGEAE
jgi:amino acid permease